MAIRITGIHLVGGHAHEHIGAVRWIQDGTATEASTTRGAVIEWLRQTRSRAYITDGPTAVDVEVVNDDPPYLRTRADGNWTDNLLSLPEY